MTLLLGLCVGVGLSAACGFRVFVPLLLLSLGATTGHFNPPESLAWVGTTPALIAFSVATVVEVLGYFIPLVDNLLNALAIPLAIAAGIVITAGFVGDLSPFFKWTLASIAGGGSAGGIKTSLTATRAASTAATGGLANPIISIFEGIFSVVMAVIAVVLPILAIILLVVTAYWLAIKWKSLQALSPWATTTQ